MKLIFESWRKYVNEQLGTITKLRIFDFDETIATTRSSTRVTTPGGKKLGFSDQKKDDDYVKAMAAKHNIKTVNPDGTARDAVSDLMDIGYMFDYSDFSKVIDPVENERIVKILGRVVGAKQERGQREVYIMTARGPDSQQPIMNYLLTLTRDDGTPRFEQSDFDGIITLAGQSKQAAIDSLIKKHANEEGVSSIRVIDFFDDSQRNLDDVIKLRDIYPDIRINVNKVEDDEITALEEEL
jgi:hypothetical protein